MNYREIERKIKNMEYEVEKGEYNFNTDLEKWLEFRGFNAQQAQVIMDEVAYRKHRWERIDVLEEMEKTIELIIEVMSLEES